MGLSDSVRLCVKELCVCVGMLTRVDPNLRRLMLSGREPSSTFESGSVEEAASGRLLGPELCEQDNYGQVLAQPNSRRTASFPGV